MINHLQPSDSDMRVFATRIFFWSLQFFEKKRGNADYRVDSAHAGREEEPSWLIKFVRTK